MQPQPVMFQAEAVGQVAFGDVLGGEGFEPLSRLDGTDPHPESQPAREPIEALLLPSRGAGGTTRAAGAA
jgi:hypothetical protein